MKRNIRFFDSSASDIWISVEMVLQALNSHRLYCLTLTHESTDCLLTCRQHRPHWLSLNSSRGHRVDLWSCGDTFLFPSHSSGLMEAWRLVEFEVYQRMYLSARHDLRSARSVMLALSDMRHREPPADSRYTTGAPQLDGPRSQAGCRLIRKRVTVKVR